jgi:hypothetical protein
MPSLIDGLPPDVAQHIHADGRKNEAAYWAERDRLLPVYHGQGVAFADGQVIAAGLDSVAIVHAAQASGQHPYVTCVGHEQEPWLRIRRVTLFW